MVQNKERFKQEDIDDWEERVAKYKSKKYNGLAFNNWTSIKIPDQMFARIITNQAPNYIYLLPYHVTFKYFEGELNYWVQNTGYLGIHGEDGHLEISLKKDQEHSQLSILWLLLHEFRHKIQTEKSVINSNIFNTNLKYFMGYLNEKGNTDDTIQHVLHEIMPYEIDANIFASEMLGIDYPGSKFEINDYTIGLLK